MTKFYRSQQACSSNDRKKIREDLDFARKRKAFAFYKGSF